MKNNASECFKEGNYEDAIKGFTECLDLFPNNKTYNSSIYMNRAISFSKLKKNEEALEDLSKAIE